MLQAGLKLLLLLLLLLLCLLEVLLCSRVRQLSRPAWAPFGLGTTGDSRENFLGYGLVTRAKLAKYQTCPEWSGVASVRVVA